MSKKDKLISVDHLKWNVGGIECGTLSVDYLNWILDHEEPTVDAVPVEFIQQRIAQLNDAIEYEFNELGEYDGWALHAQSALEQLLQAWVAERKEE